MATPRTLRGFSLLELLVAMVVLSLVIGIATYAYGMFIRHWDGQLGRFNMAQTQYQRLEWLATALEDTLPYLVQDDQGEPGFYFLGREEGLTLVTLSPIFGVGEPALIRVFREIDEEGAWQLVYEEAPFAGSVLARADQRMDFRHRLIIANDVSKPVFRYFGWADLASRVAFGDAAVADRGWFDNYDGLRRRYHPEKIEVRLGYAATVFEIPARADKAITAFVGQE